MRGRGRGRRLQGEIPGGLGGGQIPWGGWGALGGVWREFGCSDLQQAWRDLGGNSGSWEGIWGGGLGASDP